MTDHPLHEQVPNTRQTILATAQELLEKEGLEAFTLREVARRCKLSPSSLYEHFESKEAILCALQPGVEERLNAELESLPPELHPSDHLIAVGMAYLNFVRQNPGFYDLLAEPIPRERPVWMHPIYRVLSGVIQAGIDSDEFKPRPGFKLDDMVYTCWAMLHGMGQLQRGPLAGPEADLNLLNLHALEVLVKGLQMATFS